MTGGKEKQSHLIVRWSYSCYRRMSCHHSPLEAYFDILHSHTRRRSGKDATRIWLDDETFPNVYFAFQSGSPLFPSCSRCDHRQGHVSGYASNKVDLVEGWDPERNNLKAGCWFTNLLVYAGKVLIWTHESSYLSSYVFVLGGPEEMAERVEDFKSMSRHLWQGGRCRKWTCTLAKLC